MNILPNPKQPNKAGINQVAADILKVYESNNINGRTRNHQQLFRMLDAIRTGGFGGGHAVGSGVERQQTTSLSRAVHIRRLFELSASGQSFNVFAAGPTRAERRGHNARISR